MLGVSYGKAVWVRSPCSVALGWLLSPVSRLSMTASFLLWVSPSECALSVVCRNSFRILIQKSSCILAVKRTALFPLAVPLSHAPRRTSFEDALPCSFGFPSLPFSPQFRWALIAGSLAGPPPSRHNFCRPRWPDWLCYWPWRAPRVQRNRSPPASASPASLSSWLPGLP